jgi:hypothetical protein
MNSQDLDVGEPKKKVEGIVDKAVMHRFHTWNIRRDDVLGDPDSSQYSTLAVAAESPG